MAHFGCVSSLLYWFLIKAWRYYNSHFVFNLIKEFLSLVCKSFGCELGIQERRYIVSPEVLRCYFWCRWLMAEDSPFICLHVICHLLLELMGLPQWLCGKGYASNARDLQEMLVWSLGWEDSLEKEVSIHSRILAWEIPWTEESGGLQSMGSQRVSRHDWATVHSFFLELTQCILSSTWACSRVDPAAHTNPFSHCWSSPRSIGASSQFCW